MSDSLQPQGLQYSRLPCPSPTPEAFSDSCPLSWWCHPIISSFVVSFSSHLQSFPASGSFLVSSLHQVAKVLEFQFQHQSFQCIFRTDFLQDWLVGSPCSPRDSQESSPILQFKSINSLVLSFLYGPTLTWLSPNMTTGKTIALTRQIIVGKVMSLFFFLINLFFIEG